MNIFKSKSNKNINVKFLLIYTIDNENDEDYYKDNEYFDDTNEEDLEVNLKANDGDKLLIGKYVI